MEADGDGVGADGAELAGLAAGAEVVDVEVGADNEAGAVGGVAGLDDALEEGRGPVGRKDGAVGEKEASVLDGLPAGGLLEEGLGEGDEGHGAPEGGRGAGQATLRASSSSKSTISFM